MKTTRSGYVSAGFYDTNQLNGIVHVNDVPSMLGYLGRYHTLAGTAQSGVTSITDFTVIMDAALATVRFSVRETDVFHARYERGLSINETAALLGVGRQSVGTYCKRIAAKLLKTIDPIGGELL